MLRSFAAVVALLLAAATARAGDIDALDAEDGFRGARFGASADSLGGLELLSEHGAGGTRVYVRPSDVLRLGEAALDGVTYGFHQGELYFVALFTSGKRNAREALAHLEERYGAGTPVEGEATEYVWQGRKVTLHFREDPATSMGMVGMTSVRIDARVRAQRRSLPARIAP